MSSIKEILKISKIAKKKKIQRKEIIKIILQQQCACRVHKNNVNAAKYATFCVARICSISLARQ